MAIFIAQCFPGAKETIVESVFACLENATDITRNSEGVRAEMMPSQAQSDEMSQGNETHILLAKRICSYQPSE